MMAQLADRVAGVGIPGWFLLLLSVFIGSFLGTVIRRLPEGRPIMMSARSACEACGARLAPRPIAFTAFVNYVRHPTNQMPPYTAKVVSDQELADIYAFLLSIPPPAKTGVNCNVDFAEDLGAYVHAIEAFRAEHELPPAWFAIHQKNSPQHPLRIPPATHAKM